MRSLTFLIAAAALLAPAPSLASFQSEKMVAQAGVDAAFLIGRWTDTNDCTNTVDFLRDGRFITSDGVAGRWTLDGDRLTFIGQRTITARVAATGRDSLTLTHDDGSVGASTRCATPAPTAMPALPATVAQALSMTRPIEREMLIGRWTDDGDCGNIIEFFRDGRFVVPTGDGRWTLNGERLSFIGNTTVNARVRGIGRNRIILIHEDQSIGQSIRC